MKRTFSRQCVPQRFEVLSGNEVALRSQEIDHLAVDGQTSGRFATQLADDISNASLKSLALRLAVHHKARQRRLGIEHNQRAGGDELVNGTLSRGELDRDEGPVTRARRDKHAVATSPTLVQMRCNSIDQRSRFVEEVHQVLADDAAPHDALAMWRHVFRAYALPRLLIVTIRHARGVGHVNDHRGGARAYRHLRALWACDVGRARSGASWRARHAHAPVRFRHEPDQPARSGRECVPTMKVPVYSYPRKEVAKRLP